MRQPVNYDNGKYRRFGFKLGEYYHNGHDYNVDYNTEVYAITDGEVYFASMTVSGFGGLNPSKQGGLIIIKHFDNFKGRIFWAIYGHVLHTLQKDDVVKEGQIIGRVDNFVNNGLILPHLHLSLTMQQNAPLPPFGYVPPERLKNYIDPVLFFDGRGIKL